MINRDSVLLWVAALSALVMYLQGAPDPRTWDYSAWLQFAGFGLAWVSGKLATSPLPGAGERR